MLPVDLLLAPEILKPNCSMLPLLDEAFQAQEQLPRVLEVALVETNAGTVDAWVEPVDGPLRKIRSNDSDLRQGDGFRWSFALHLALAAHLGWSPKLRHCLGLRRRSNRTWEKGEDGVRAEMMEEAILTLIFNGPPLDRHNLQAIKELTATYEVGATSIETWRHTLENGLKILGEIRNTRGGFITVNLHSRTLNFRRFRKLPDDTFKPTPKTPFKHFTIFTKRTKSDIAEIFLPLKHGGFINIGSKAEEWGRTDQAFKWHDVFHMINWCLLGWGPVAEHLLRIPILDNSPKAATLEEAVVALIYSRVTPFTTTFQLSQQLLMEIRTLLNSTLAINIPAEAWDISIRRASCIINELSVHGEGYLELDAENRVVSLRGADRATLV